MVYPEVLMQHIADMRLSEAARQYLWEHLDPEHDDALRHVIHHLYLPEFNSYSDTTKHHYKRALQWMINCADDELCDTVGDWDPDTVVPPPADRRRLFVLWWEALFAGEDYRSTEICSAEAADINNHLSGIFEGPGEYEISDEVLLFPRVDGHPPGEGAPEQVFRDATPPKLPRRPTDGARFFRWEDQAKAIKKAQKIYKKAHIQKVWVEFGFPVGEGYRTGNPDPNAVWETNYAIVRFRDGKPVDSYPDLRKGWVR